MKFWIFSSYNFFEEATFSDKMVKKNGGGTRPFFRRWGHLMPKVNITFFNHKLDAKYFHVKQFFRKKQYFLKKLTKTVLGAPLTIFRKRRHLTQKINITFFITNYVPDILLFNTFFERSSIFWKNCEKPFTGIPSHFTEICFCRMPVPPKINFTELNVPKDNFIEYLYERKTIFWIHIAESILPEWCQIWKLFT